VNYPSERSTALLVAQYFFLLRSQQRLLGDVKRKPPNMTKANRTMDERAQGDENNAQSLESKGNSND